LSRGDLDAKVLERARSYVLGRAPFEVANAADMLSPVLRSELLGEPVDTIFKSTERIEAVRDSDVIAALQKHVTRDTRSVAMVGDGSMQEILRKRFSHARVEAVDFQAELKG
ncbi:MAG: hypothetical protein H7Z43_07210, partial [Clostridia bacterium]|nr:hypothetical protein [Deltaproteobacteria bacterium]